MRFQPSDSDRARLNQKYRMDEQAAFVEEMQDRLRPETSTMASSYAYSQEPGWGPLIISGQMQSNLDVTASTASSSLSH